ncbi:MAG: S1 RNA-binding domain-containing protein, partial [Chloroflexi bacterium]|nr:S1 RNA-binding domain-containing protein [Chloroflexota bacterium]
MDWKKNNQNQDSAPILDDSWWNSLLENANKYPGFDGGSQTNLNEMNNTSDIDWPLMERYFHDDEILKVEVIGFNKGGLLVKGDHFKGFIPNSHLKEISRIQSVSERYQALKEAVGQFLKVKVIEC